MLGSYGKTTNNTEEQFEVQLSKSNLDIQTEVIIRHYKSEIRRAPNL